MFLACCSRMLSNILHVIKIDGNKFYSHSLLFGTPYYSRLSGRSPLVFFCLLRKIYNVQRNNKLRLHIIPWKVSASRIELHVRICQMTTVVA